MDINYRLVSKIEGIHCAGCLNRIKSKLSSLNAINVDIEIQLNIIKVDYIGSEEEADKFIYAINSLGYKAEKIIVFNLEEVYNS